MLNVKDGDFLIIGIIISTKPKRGFLDFSPFVDLLLFVCVRNCSRQMRWWDVSFDAITTCKFDSDCLVFGLQRPNFKLRTSEIRSNSILLEESLMKFLRYKSVWKLNGLEIKLNLIQQKIRNWKINTSDILCWI